MHLLQQLACFQIPAFGENTNSGCISTLCLLFSNHSYTTTQDGRSFGFTQTKPRQGAAGRDATNTMQKQAAVPQHSSFTLCPTVRQLWCRTAGPVTAGTSQARQLPPAAPRNARSQPLQPPRAPAGHIT